MAQQENFYNHKLGHNQHPCKHCELRSSSRFSIEIGSLVCILYSIQLVVPQVSLRWSHQQLLVEVGDQALRGLICLDAVNQTVVELLDFEQELGLNLCNLVLAKVVVEIGGEQLLGDNVLF